MNIRRAALIGTMAVVATPGTGPGAWAQTTQPAVGARSAAPSGARPSGAPNAVSNPEAGPRTLLEALGAAYSNDPQLLAERAKLRATDENVPTALAGWRPQLVAAGSVGYGDGRQATRQSIPAVGFSPATNEKISQDLERDQAQAQLTLTQPIYRGGRTRASTNRAENQVYGERARLIEQESTTFQNVVNAYVGVIQAQQILQLDLNNEQVLAKQLQATNDRFRVGEITRTDVAQAEAALAGAQATRETAAGNLQTARATFQRATGYLPSGDLVPPQPLATPIKSEQEAVTVAAANNPQVIAAQFDDAAAKDAVDVAYSALMPNVSFQGQAFNQTNPSTTGGSGRGYTATVQLSVPIYQGGSEYAGVRQARQTQQQTRKLVDDARRAAQQSAIQAWETLVAARATVDSTRSQIRANRIALEGVEREAIVGSRTTLDVLNAQQALLNSEVTLVQNLASLVTASYQVANAIGRLTARDLNLSVPLYDETAYYEEVRDKLIGTGDYATDQPGR